MKYFTALPVTIALLLGLASGAQAWPQMSHAPQHNRVEANSFRTDYKTDAPYTECHGLNSGTADASCGTATGGPSGGLN